MELRHQINKILILFILIELIAFFKKEKKYIKNRFFNFGKLFFFLLDQIII